jgi:DNA-binding NarL/FixJ family response regulator
MPRILIADDHEAVLRQLSSILAEQKNWSVCGQAANGRQAVLMAHQLKPDLIILDIGMPMLDGLSAASGDSEEFARHSDHSVLTLQKRTGGARSKKGRRKKGCFSSRRTCSDVRACRADAVGASF